MIEKHYTIHELSDLLNISQEKARQLVKDEPGVLTHLLHHVGGSCSFPAGCNFEIGLVTRFLST
jgi:hypothetical protein